MRLHVITLRYSPAIGAFDPSTLHEFLHDKELLSSEPHFFLADGVPHLVLVLGWREPDAHAPGMEPARAGSAPRNAKRASSANSPSDPTGGLSERDRLVFDAVRRWRAETARDEGVPPYLVLTNRQALELIAKRPASITALAQIDGVGKAKVERYGKDLLRLLGGAATQPPVSPEPTT